MIDNRTAAILMAMFANQRAPLYELSIQTGIAEEELYVQLGAINQLLKEHALSQIQYDRDTFVISKELYQQKKEVFALLRYQQIYLSQRERPFLIYLYTFIRNGFISNNHYQDLLHVSRNTALSDIKAVKDLAFSFEVELSYTRQKGYHLLGKEVAKYRLALYAISALLQSPIGAWTLDYILKVWHEDNPINLLKSQSQKCCQSYHVSVLEERLEEYLYLLILVSIRQKRVKASVKGTCQTRYRATQMIFDRLWEVLHSFKEMRSDVTKDTKDYLCQLLQGCIEGNDSLSDSFFESLTLEIVEEMERLSLISFDHRQEMIEGIRRHLIPAYYRLVSGLVNCHTYTNTIKQEHADLFYLVKKALKPLEKHLGFPIPDSEVSYFVIHFGGYIEEKQACAYPYRALVICPNGVSSSLIVKESLRQLFPNIAFRDSYGLKEWQELDMTAYDMVFATIKLDTSLPFFLVPQIMTTNQQKDLFKRVNQVFPNAAYIPLEIEQLLSLVGKHATIHQEQALKYELVQFLNQRSMKEKGRSPMLEELITNETFHYTADRLSWQEAIALSAKPLLEKGKIDNGYVKAMIDKVNTFGAFIDLGRGVAIPHARPDEGVNDIGMSMLVLDEPVYLLDDPSHEIKVMICIAAIDNHTHLRALSHLTKILREENNIRCLVNAREFSDIADLLKEE